MFKAWHYWGVDYIFCIYNAEIKHIVFIYSTLSTLKSTPMLIYSIHLYKELNFTIQYYLLYIYQRLFNEYENMLWKLYNVINFKMWEAFK